MRQRQQGTDTLREFLIYFHDRGVSEEVALAIFREIQRWNDDPSGRIAIRPSDRLESVYGITSDEIRITIEPLLGACERRWPEPSATDGTAEIASIATLEDLVRFVAACPPKSS